MNWNIKETNKGRGGVIMDFSDNSWNFNNFAPELYQTCAFFAGIKTFCISSETLDFPTFSAKCYKCKI